MNFQMYSFTKKEKENSQAQFLKLRYQIPVSY